MRVKMSDVATLAAASSGGGALYKLWGPSDFKLHINVTVKWGLPTHTYTGDVSEITPVHIRLVNANDASFTTHVSSSSVYCLSYAWMSAVWINSNESKGASESSSDEVKFGHAASASSSSAAATAAVSGGNTYSESDFKVGTSIAMKWLPATKPWTKLKRLVRTITGDVQFVLSDGIRLDNAVDCGVCVHGVCYIQYAWMSDVIYTRESKTAAIGPVKEPTGSAADPIRVGCYVINQRIVRCVKEMVLIRTTLLAVTLIHHSH